MEAWSFPPRPTTRTIFRMLPAATGFASARRCPRRRAKRAFSSACNRSAPTPTRTPPSTGANGTKPGFTRRSSGRSRTSNRRSPSYKRRTCAPRRRGRPPFGDYLCVPERDIFHIHGTSGTTGRPTAFAIGRNDWRAMANAHARVMWAMGLRPGDTICVAAIFSPLPRKLGRSCRRRAARRPLLSLRRRRRRHVGARARSGSIW